MLRRDKGSAANDSASPRPTLLLCILALFLFIHLALAESHFAFISSQPTIVLQLQAAMISAWLAFASIFACNHVVSFLFSLADLRRLGYSPRKHERHPHVALLYLCKDDISETALASCASQDYPNFNVYVLDDSCLPTEQLRVEAACAVHGDRTIIVRRIDRGFGHKAGNLNNALRVLPRNIEYICIADADEILPDHFVRETVAICEARPQLGFVQTTHSQYGLTEFAKQTGDADLHWKYFFPARNSRGFVYSFGHGVTFRRAALEAVGGFPEVVAEDIAVSVLLREAGFRGYFSHEISCQEEAPSSYVRFRRRNRKITLGTLQFLGSFCLRFLRNPQVSVTEKVDMLMSSLVSLLPSIFIAVLLLLCALSALSIVFDGAAARIHLSEAVQPDARLTVLAFFTVFAQLVYLLPNLIQTPLRTLAFVARASTVHLSVCADSVRATLQWLRRRSAHFQNTGDRGLDAATADSASVDLFLGITFLCISVLSASPFLAAVGLALALVPRLLRHDLNGPLAAGLVLCPLLFTIAGLLGAPGTALAATALLATFAIAHH